MSDERPDDIVDDEELSDELPAPGQATMFGSDDDFRTAYIEWQGMPEYSVTNLMPHSSLLIHFRSDDDRKRFLELIDVNPIRTGSGSNKSVWWPELEIASYADKRYRTVESDPIDDWLDQPL